MYSIINGYNYLYKYYLGGKENMKYEVYDLYDYRELLGTVDTMEEVNRLKNERILDTDGECYIIIEEVFS